MNFLCWILFLVGLTLVEGTSTTTKTKSTSTSWATSIESSTTSQRYTCTKTTSLGTASSVTGVTAAPSPNPSTGFKLAYAGLLTDNTSQIDGNFNVVHNNNRPDNLYIRNGFGYGAIGFWPGWPEPTFLQEASTGKLYIADLIQHGSKQWYLSTGANGANVSMRSTLDSGESWVICEPLKANKSVSCRPSTSTTGNGFRWWAAPDTDSGNYLCESNFGPDSLSTQFTTKQPANAGVQPETNVPCPDYKAFNVIAVQAPAPQKEPLYNLVVSSKDDTINDYRLLTEYNDAGEEYIAAWDAVFPDIFRFEKRYYNGTQRVVSWDSGDASPNGFLTVDYARENATVFTAQKPTGTQKALECVVDRATSELKCAVDGKVYPWQIAELWPGHDLAPAFFGPCVKASDKAGFNYSMVTIHVDEVYHFSSELYTNYNYGG